ncbi:MAG: hypothetical protein EXS11_04550 [Gemmataceae bacterium]|nr:hypothetical protein [Gemmataceae bacterium]
MATWSKQTAVHGRYFKPYLDHSVNPATENRPGDKKGPGGGKISLGSPSATNKRFMELIFSYAFTGFRA